LHASQLPFGNRDRILCIRSPFLKQDVILLKKRVPNGIGNVPATRTTAPFRTMPAFVAWHAPWSMNRMAIAGHLFSPGVPALWKLSALGLTGVVTTFASLVTTGYAGILLAGLGGFDLQTPVLTGKHFSLFPAVQTVSVEASQPAAAITMDQVAMPEGMTLTKHFDFQSTPLAASPLAEAAVTVTVKEVSGGSVILDTTALQADRAQFTGAGFQTYFHVSENTGLTAPAFTMHHVRAHGVAVDITRLRWKYAQVTIGFRKTGAPETIVTATIRRPHAP
jgi:hypothetical protein